MKHLIKAHIFLFLFLSNIQGQIITPSKIFTVPLPDNISNKSVIGLKEITNKIEYVKLEFSPESIVGRIVLLSATERYFFVYDMRGVYQFSRQGKFVRKIGKQGRGPGEYVAIKEMTADEDSQRFYILCNFVKQVLVYDFNGNYLYQIPLKDDFINCFDIIDNDMIALQTGQLSKTVLTSSIINTKGASVYKFTNRLYHNTNEISFYKEPIITYLYHNNLFLKDGINDTVYKVTSLRFIPYFVYNLGKYKPHINCPSEQQGKYFFIDKIFETDKFVYSFFRYKGVINVSKFNKESNETTMSFSNSKLHIGIINDFDNGIDFSVYNRPLSTKTTQNELLLTPDSKTLNSYKNNANIRGDFQALISQYELSDNPVIMVIKLK